MIHNSRLQLGARPWQTNVIVAHQVAWVAWIAWVKAI